MEFSGLNFPKSFLCPWEVCTLQGLDKNGDRAPQGSSAQQTDFSAFMSPVSPMKATAHSLLGTWGLPPLPPHFVAPLRKKP